jgi:hypothetical protein
MYSAQNSLLPVCHSNLPALSDGCKIPVCALPRTGTHFRCLAARASGRPGRAHGEAKQLAKAGNAYQR